MAEDKKKARSLQLEEDILNTLSKLYGTELTYRQIAARLSIQYFKNVKDYIPVLEKLKNESKIQAAGRNKYFKPYKSAMIVGRIDIKKTGEGYIQSQDFPEEIVVESGMQNRALQGDLVEVAILAKKGKRVKGEVVRIIERNKKHFAGILKVHAHFAFLVTDDRKMHKDIFIPLEKDLEKWDGYKALVAITDWPKDAKNPFGKVVKILGKPGENEAEMNAIVAEFGFATDFPEEVIHESQKLDGYISPEEVKKRMDLRKTPTFTIDPETAKDFDDAISVKILAKGLFEIGVHIADVSYYVTPGSAIDKEAQKRGTSVYLVDRTIPMLPHRLSNDLCSLNPNEDKPAFSAIFQMDATGKVKKVKFAKSVIHSIHRFTYEKAQEVLDNQEGPLLEELNIVNSIAKNLKKKRFEEGSMSFESTEFKFDLDKNGKPTGIAVKVRGETHFLVEEFMLLANKHVAKFGKQAHENQKTPFVYRFHDQPNEVKLLDFKNFAAKWGYQIKLGSPAQVKKSINQLLEKIKDKPEEGVLSQLAIRSMAKATYTPNSATHFGLGFEFYTHFTSPIRRYPDLLVHRMLFSHVSHGKRKYPYPDNSEVEELCKSSSTMEQKASEAERASIKYKQAEWMKDHIGKQFEGVITGVTDWGIFVELTDNKCEGLIKLSSLKDDMYDLDENNLRLVGRYYFKKHSLGDKVVVIIKEANPLARTIDFDLIENISSGQGKQVERSHIKPSRPKSKRRR